jgi:lipopolysaccharide biosynthesis regulator YciM/uncharacterized protein HemY
MLLWDTFFDAGEAQLKNGKYVKAEKLLKSALGEANSFEPDDPRLLRTLLALVNVYQKSDRPQDAEPLLKRAEDLIESTGTVSAPVQSEVVDALLTQLKFEEPDKHAESALRERRVQVWQKGGPEFRENLLDSLLELSLSLRASASEEEARAKIQQALAVAEELHGAESEAVDRVLGLLAQSYIISKAFSEAEESGRRRLEIQTALFGEDDPRLAPTLAVLSHVVEKQRRMDEALPLIERASSIPGDEKTFYYLGFVEALLRAGSPAEALAKLITLEKVNVQGELSDRYELLLLRAYRGVEDWPALEEQAERISSDETVTPLARLEAFVVRCEQSDNKDEEHIGPFLDQIAELDSPELDSDGELLTRVASIARSAGRRDVSEAFYDRAIQAQTKDLDTNDPQSVKILFQLGSIQEKRRLLPDAVSSWERSLEYLRRHNGQVDSPAEERRMRIQLVERLADIYIRQRRWERAEQAWRSLVRSSPAASLEHARGRLGLTTVYVGLEDHQKAFEYLQSSDMSSFDEAQAGRELSDAAFLLETECLVELGRADEAAKKRDVRCSRRGGPEGFSVSELYASVLISKATRDEERFQEDGRELATRRPEDSTGQLRMANFFVLVAENNARYYPPEPMPFGLSPLQALEKAIYWGVEANGERDLTVAELYEESAKAAVAESAWTEAEKSTRKSLELYELLKGNRSPLLLTSLQRLGELHLGKGQLDEAIESFDRALDLARDHLKPQDVQVRELLRSLVEAHRRRGEFEESRRYLNQLLGLYDRFEELGVEGKLDDLMRGIRLLLGDDGDHEEKLSSYLDEATELALARGSVAELSLAFCLGQKARLIAPRDPDAAIALLRQQSTTLESREEAPEFTGDQLLLGQLLLFRGQPKAALSVIKRLSQEDTVSLGKPEWTREARILEARAYSQLHQFDLLGQQLDELTMLVEDESSKVLSQKAEVFALKLNLYHHKPDLIGEEDGAATYAELDQLVENGDWTEFTAQHEVRERRFWELARLSFEARRLTPEASVNRLTEHVSSLRDEVERHPAPLADALAYLGQLEETSGSHELAYEHLSEARRIYEECGDATSLSRARTVASAGRLAEILDQDEDAVEAYRVAVKGLEFHLGSGHATLVPLHLGLGRLGRKMGDLEAAESALQQAVDLLDELQDGLPMPLRSSVLRELGALYSQQKRTREARETWIRLQEMWEDTGELLPTAWMEEFGAALVADDAFAEALQFFLDTLPLRLDQGDDATLLALYGLWLEMTCDCPSVTLASESAGHLAEVRDVVYGSLGEEPTAEFEVLWSRILVGFARLHLSGIHAGGDTVEEDLEEALRIREAHLGSESNAVGDVLSLRAHLAFSIDDLGTAENCLTRALNIVESNLGPDTWEVAEILLQLATVYFKKQRFSPTEAVLQRTLELCRTLLADNDDRWIKVCHLRGKLSLELGRPAEAFGSLDRALKLCKKHLQPPSRSLLIASGRACLLTERSDRALDLFTKAEAYFSTEVEYWDEETEDVKLALGELLLERGRYDEAFERLTKVLQQQENRFGFGDPNLGRVYRALGRTACGLGDLDTAEERLEIALALQEEDLFSPLDLFGPFFQLACLHREEGSEDRATAILEENLERARSSGRHEKIAQMCRLLAVSCERRGDLVAAEAAWREAIERLETALEMSAEESKRDLYETILEPLQKLAILLTSHRRYTAAEELTKRRLKYTELLEPGQEDVSNVLFDLAELYRIQELFRESGELHERVFNTRRAELGRTHPEVAKSLRAMGQIALGQKDVEEAGSYLQRALEHQTEELGARHPDLAETLFALGDLALLEKEFGTAEERYRTALGILEEHFGESNYRTAKGWTSLAKLFEQKQQWSRAQPLLGRAVESVEAVLGPSHLEVADLLEKTAKVYLVSGAFDEVSEPLERALLIRQESLGDDHPATARVLKLQADHNALLGDLKAARRLYCRADNIISDFHGADSPSRFPYRFAFARTLRRLNEYEQAESHFQVMLEQLEGDDPETLLKIADIREELAQLHLAQGRLEEAEVTIKDVLDARSKFLSPNSEEVSSAFETLARIHHADDREVTASALAERALDALEIEDENVEGPASSVISRARLQCLLARIELDQGSPSSAIPSANEALNLLRDLLGEAHPDVAEVLHLLGEIAQSERKLEKAESYFENALEKWEAFFGGSHPSVCLAVSSLAQLYQQQGRLTLAEQFHQRNLVSLEGRYGAGNPVLVETLLGLGKLCRSQGNVAEAEVHLKRAAEIQGSVSGGTDLKMAEILHILALVYQDQRNFIASEALLKKARDLRKRLADDDSSEIAESNLALARLYRTSGKSSEAEPLLKSVLEWRSERLGEDHPEVASLLREMAELYADQKEYLMAQSLVKKALGIYGEALGHRNLELVGPLRQLARLLDASGDSEEAEKQRRLAEELMGAG